MSRLGIASVVCGIVALGFALFWKLSIGSVPAFGLAFVLGGCAVFLGFISWQWTTVDPEAPSRRPATVGLATGLAAIGIVLTINVLIDLR